MLEIDLSKLQATERTISVGTASTLILRVNPNRIWAQFTNDGANVIYLSFKSPAVVSQGFRINASGGAFEFDQINTPWTGELYGIASGGASVLSGQEIEQKL